MCIANIWYVVKDTNDQLRSKLKVGSGVSIVSVPSMCVSTVSIVCFDVTHGFLQGEDAEDFNPDRFLGNLSAELTADTKDGASFLLYLIRLLLTSFLVYML